MDVRLTQEQENFIRHAIQTGRFATPDEAVREALMLLEEREGEVAELRAKIEEGLLDLETGQYTDYTDETLPRMMDDIRREGRELHVADRQSG